MILERDRPEAAPAETCRVRVAAPLLLKPLVPMVPNGLPIRVPGEDALGPYVLEIGAVNKNRAANDQVNCCPAWGIDEMAMLFALLRQYDLRATFPEHWFAPSFSELFRCYTGTSSYGSRAWTAFKARLDTVIGTHFRIVRSDGSCLGDHIFTAQTVQQYFWASKEKPHGMQFARIEFSPAFLACIRPLNTPAHDFRFDVLRRMPTQAARAAYLFLPAFASNPNVSEQHPYRAHIPTTIAAHLGLTELTYPVRGKNLPLPESRRLHRMGFRPDQLQNPFAALDGAELRVEGETLRTRVVGEIIEAWVGRRDPKPTSQEHSRVHAMYLAAGGDDAAYRKLTASVPELDGYERDQAQKALCLAELETDPQTHNFLRRVKAVMPRAEFHRCLADGKDFALTGSKVLNSRGARLRTVMLNSLRDGHIVRSAT